MFGRSLAQIGTAVVFSSHGCAALLTSNNVTAEWVGWIVHFLPLSFFQGAMLLKAIGTLDIALALFLIATPRPTRWVALWCIFWATLTAAMRFYFYGGLDFDFYFSAQSALLLKPFGEVLVRVFNVSLPMILFCECVGKVPPATNVLMRLMSLYFLGAFLLDLNRLLNYPGDMVFAFNLFSKQEFLSLMGAAFTVFLGFAVGQRTGKICLFVLATMAFGHELWVNWSFLEFDLLRASKFYAGVQWMERMGVIFALAIIVDRAGVWPAVRSALGRAFQKKYVALHGEGR